MKMRKEQEDREGEEEKDGGGRKKMSNMDLSLRNYGL